MKTAFLSTICVLMASSLTFAFSGGGATGVGSGGDSYAIQFVEVAQSLVQYFSANPGLQFDDKKFAAAINSTKIESTEQNLSLNGANKDAINYPQEKRIVFSRRAWDASSGQNYRAVLVLHEYLGIMKIDDLGYHRSNTLLSKYSFGRASGFKNKLPGGPNLVSITIQGTLAKTMYDHLQVPTTIIPGIDGEQKTKEAKGITCAVMSGTDHYACYLDLSSSGVYP